jgi:ribosomal protein S18 acetylase RimI-like enzyme
MSSSNNSNNNNFLVREAVAEDWQAIANLHLQSWRSAYREILSDEYLDGEAADERPRTWRERIGSGVPPFRGTFVAERDGQLVGFVNVELQAEYAGKWGPRVENLHSHPECKGQGIGRRLLMRGAQWVEEKLPGSAIHLYVFEKNAAARAFYRHMGASEVEWITVHMPDGRDLPEYICWWPSARQLAEL